MRFADCHPDRPHLSQGLCGACYQRQRRKKQSVFLHEREYNRRYRETHKAVISGKLKAWREKNKDYVASAKEAQRVKQKYKISLEQIAAMAEAQQHCCKICSNKRPLTVDHCHSTGVVRGLLCQQCNSVLGLAYDDQAILHNAIRYLQESLWPQ